jgi:phage shock protein A
MLYLIEKLATAVRGGTREVLETAVDANAQRIFAQEIYECETNLRQSKQHLAQVMAEKLHLQRQMEAHQTRMAGKESAIRAQLQQGNEAAALPLAEELAQQESWLKTQQRQQHQLAAYEQRLLHTLKTAASKLEHYRAELRMAQATTHAQQAVGKLAGQPNAHSETFARMQDSLERIQQRHNAFDDKLEAMQQIDAYLSGEPTEKQQHQQRASDILARLREHDK